MTIATTSRSMTSTTRKPVYLTVKMTPKSISSPTLIKFGKMQYLRTRPLKKTIEDMPNVVYTAKGHERAQPSTQGALVYLKTASGTDSLAWVDVQGKRVTDSPFRILTAARCMPETPAVPRLPNHNELVEAAVKGACG